jgi:hypothetical protein
MIGEKIISTTNAIKKSNICFKYALYIFFKIDKCYLIHSK